MELSKSQGNNADINILFIEPFYGGSHKVLIDTLKNHFSNSKLVTLPAKKWHWRARCGALMLYNLIPELGPESILFTSSVLNLSDLLGMRPDLQRLRKVVYFHENQLMYPVQEIKRRDIQYAYNEITTCIAADLILFNSNFNRTSFLDNIEKIIKILPDFKPKNITDIIGPKSKVLHFPTEFPHIITTDRNKSTCLHIVWPHRWEFDKGPEDFFKVLLKLRENKFQFVVSILGESFTNNPTIFTRAKECLTNEIKHFGYVENKDEYFKILQNAHVVVSTAKHEFFGVSMLEATYCGCYPLAPNSLVYPEMYPKECLYDSTEELYERLEKFSKMALVVPDAVLENYTCYMCDKYLTVAPITDHPQGGSVCGRCQNAIKRSAPLFQCEFLPTIEEQPIAIPYGIFGYMNHLFPCINRFEGCNALLPFAEVADHEKSCLSKTTKCLNCSNFEGTGSQQVTHIKNNHPRNYFEKAKFSLDITRNKTIATTNLVKTENFLFLLNVKSDMIRKQVEIQVKKLSKDVNSTSYLLCFLKGRNEEIFVHTTSKKDEGNTETFYFHDVKIDYPLDKVKIHCECMHC